MKKLQSSLTNMVLSLGIIAIAAAALLAWMNRLTEEPIRLAELAKQESAIKEVSPAFTNSPVAEEILTSSADGEQAACYPARDNGRLVGVAVKTVSHNGFNGDIELMVGFTPEGNIYNYSVLKQGETPGLGTRMVDWFKTDKNRQSIVGRDPARDNMTVSKDGGDVDAITSATISSRAFLDAVNRAYGVFRQVSGQLSAASVAEAAPADTTGVVTNN